MLDRHFVATFSALMGGLLSCQLPSGAPAPEGLPAVAAAPVRTAPAAPVARDFVEVRAYLETQRGMRLTEPEVDRLARAIVASAREHDLEVSLVLAVIHVESRFDAFAQSKVGALGLMQILPSTGEELAARVGVPWRGAQTLFDPADNVRLGTAYLRQLADRYDSIPTALAAYNWGPGRIDRRLRSGEPLPTKYPSLVLEAHQTRTAHL